MEFAAPQVIRMVMAVSVAESLFAHTMKAGSLPHGRSTLHQPSRCDMTEGVWSDIASGHVKASNSHPRSKAGFDRCHRPAIPFREVALCDAEPGPPSKVSKQQRHCRARAPGQ